MFSRMFVRLLAAAVVIRGTASSQASVPLGTVGPARGYLVLEGGGAPVTAIFARFVALAGGKEAKIVVIPTASAPEPAGDAYLTHLRTRLQELLGVQDVTVLHTRDRGLADTEAFVAPLQVASGVWILGGGEERLVAAYLGTRTEREIKVLLERGGVVGGTSAGAIIQSSYIEAEGDTNYTAPIREIMRAHALGSGFGLLSNSVVAPHFMQRGRARRAESQPQTVSPGAMQCSADRCAYRLRG